jgi:holo-[acyl-carrier protein] synthase
VIVAIGLDVVDASRIAHALGAFGGRFEERVFTPAERREVAQRADRTLALAARFAAKEAFLKALGTGLGPGLSFQQVEVLRAENGAPHVTLTGRAAEGARERGVRRIHVTLTHHGTIAAAAVILEA